MTGMVIIGAGESGTRAAFALREAGYDGPVTLIGAEPGLPIERASPREACGRLAAWRLCRAERLVEAEIDYRPQRTATAIDPAARTVKVADGEPIGFDSLLLATGARPHRLTCVGAEQVLTLRSHADSLALHQAVDAMTHVVIVGSGFIATELAASLRERGAMVTVVAAATGLLCNAVPGPLKDRLLARHEAEGVSFYFGATIKGVGQYGVSLADGSVVSGDIVVSAVGGVPRVALARGAGLAIDGGIHVDTRLETSVPGIFAAGDCAAIEHNGARVGCETWPNICVQAEVAARNMMGENLSYRMAPCLWSDQYDLGLRVIGRVPAMSAGMISRRLPSGAEFVFYLAEDGSVRAAAGLSEAADDGEAIAAAERAVTGALRLDPAALADPSLDLDHYLMSAAA